MSEFQPDNYDTSYLDDIEGAASDYPVTQPTTQQRKTGTPSNWLPAVAEQPVTRVRRITPAEMTQVSAALTAQPTNGEIDASAMASMKTVSEKSTPMERARALGVHGLLLLAAAAILSATFWLAGLDTAWALMLFGVTVFGSMVYIYRESNEFSPTGVERRKSKEYAKIRHHEIDSQERIALRKIDAYTEVIRNVYGDNDER